MGDYVAGSCTIFDYPPEHAPSVATIVFENFDSIDWSERIKNLNTVQLGARYTNDSLRLGSSWDIGNDLDKLDCTYSIHEGGIYEYPPSVRLYSPVVGLYVGVQDNDEQNVCYYSDVHGWLEKLRSERSNPIDITQLLSMFEEEFGVEKWTREFQRLIEFHQAN